MKPLFVKNKTNENKRVIGMMIAPQGYQKYSQYSYQAFRASQGLMDDIKEGRLVVNDGIKDLDPNSGYAYVINEVTVNPVFLGDGMMVPVGGMAARPTDAAQGTIRFNISTNALEIFVANTWLSMGANVATQKNVAYAYKTDIQYLAKTPQAITFNHLDRMDTIFSYTDGAFHVEKSGWYRINANLAFDIDSNKETTTENYLTVNGSFLSGSKAYSYSAKKGNGEAATVISVFCNLAAFSIVSVISRVITGSAPDVPYVGSPPPSSVDNTHTIRDGCRVMIEEVD